MKNSTDFETIGKIIKDSSEQINRGINDVLNAHDLKGLVISGFTVAKEPSEAEASPLCVDIAATLRDNGVTVGEVCSITLTTPTALGRIGGTSSLFGWCLDCGEPEQDSIECRIIPCPDDEIK